MNSNSSDKLVRAFEERLPNFDERMEYSYYQRELYREAVAARELFRDFLDQKSYSLTHPVGPLEFSLKIDGELENRLDTVSAEQLRTNRHLEGIKESVKNVELAGRETASQLVLIREGTDHLSGIELRLESLDRIGKANFGVSAIGAAISAYQSHQLSDIQNGIGDMHGDMIDGFDCVQESIDDMHSDMVEGHREIIVTMQEISSAIAQILQEGFFGLSDEIQLLRAEQHRGFQVVMGAFQAFDANQERRHKELSLTIIDSAKRKLEFEADERYSVALQQFKVGNHKKAIQELRKSLSVQSTHLPSLLLLGRISAMKANWADSKDTYYAVAQLALSNGDISAYEVAILALAQIEKNVGNKKQADKLLKKAIDDWKEKVGEDRTKQDNAPVALNYEFYKQFLFGMAENIANTNFAQLVKHLKYDDYTYRPYEPEVKIDIPSLNNCIRDTVRNFVDTWEPELCRIMKELDAECFKYEVKLKGNNDQLSFDDSSLFAFSKFKKAFSEEVKKIDVWLQLAFSKDPYHSYFLDFEPLDKLQAFINEKERELRGVISKHVCTRGWMSSDGWFYDGCDNNFKYDVTITTRCCDVIRKEIDQNFHGNFDYNMANDEENYIDEFLSLSEYLRSCCSWLVSNCERHLAGGKLPLDKQQRLMKTVLSLYADLFKLEQRFGGRNPKVSGKDDLINLTKVMTAITSTINGLVIGIEARVKRPKSRKKNPLTSQ